MKKSIFTKIYLNKVHSFKIIEDYYSVAILDIYPLQKGHSLVFPKDQVNDIYKLPLYKFINMMYLVRRLSFCLKNIFCVKKVGVIISGFDVLDHVHIHLIPANKEDDLNFHNKRIFITKSELLFLQNKISNALSLVK
jgi:histidine triad (HIT) family protein